MLASVFHVALTIALLSIPLQEQLQSHSNLLITVALIVHRLAALYSGSQSY